MQGNEKFKQMVNDWQTKLGTVESVLTCWGDVQACAPCCLSGHASSSTVMHMVMHTAS